MVNEAQIQLAIKALENGEVTSMRKAAEKYGVALTTLHDRITCKHQAAVGCGTTLSETTETLLVELLIKMSDIGFSLTKNEVLETVTNYLTSIQASHLFKNGAPTKNWYYSFINRHKDKLATKKTNNMPCNRAQSTNSIVIDRWFEGLSKIYEKYSFHEKPCHVFNCDESGMTCDQGRFKVITRKGSRAPSRLCVSNNKQMYTTLACCSAQGDFMPLHTVFKGLRLMSSWTQGGAIGTSYDVSDSGWMEGDQFYKWFITYFIEHCKKLNGYKLLFLDGHASHITFKLIDAAIENQIVLYKLAAHTSHLFQPLDVAVFGPLKNHWREVLNNHCKANGFKDIAKHNFPALMKIACEKGLIKENARAGFEASGLWPLNRNKVSNEKLQIGSVFDSTVLRETVEEETIAEDIVEVPVLLKENRTPKSASTPKKRKLSIEESLKSIKKAFHDSTNAAAESLCSSVLSVMVKTYAKTPKPTENFRLESNHCLTGEEIRKQIVEKQLASENEKKRIEQNKLDRAQKKIVKEKAASDKSAEREARLLKSQQPEFVKPKRSYTKRKLDMGHVKTPSVDSQFDKVCANIKCAAELSEAASNHQKLWKSCEECDNWYCGICSVNFLDDDDICKNC